MTLNRRHPSRAKPAWPWTGVVVVLLVVLLAGEAAAGGVTGGRGRVSGPDSADRVDGLDRLDRLDSVDELVGLDELDGLVGAASVWGRPPSAFSGAAEARFTVSGIAEASSTVWAAVRPRNLLGLWAVADEEPTSCADACQMVLRDAVFADGTTKDGGGGPGRGRRVDRTCGSHLQQTSLFLCLRTYCGGYVASPGIERLNASCAAAGRALPSYGQLVDGYTDADAAALRRLQQSEIETYPPATLDEVVVPAADLQRHAYDTLDAWAFAFRNHRLYGALMLLFWMLVFAGGITARVVHAATRAVRRLRQRAYQRLPSAPADGEEDSGHEEGPVGETMADEALLAKRRAAPLRGRAGVWLRRHVTLPGTFGYRCAQDFGWYTVPPRVQSLAISVFVLLNVAASVLGYRVFAGNLYYPLVRQQLYRYVSDRTGIVSFANLPLVWLLGLRNNVLLWLTGWDFGTMSNLHRWAARAATVQAIVHSVGYTLIVCERGGLSQITGMWVLHYWWTGCVATFFMSLLLVFSLFWMRRHVYELFLVIHIGFSVLVLWGMFGHVSIFHGRYDGFLWLCVYVWLADRALRLLRILAFNPRFWATRAAVSFDPRTNIVRLVVPYAASLYQPRPGTYYYLHVLGDRCFWESHPFTVASVTTRDAPETTQDALDTKGIRCPSPVDSESSALLTGSTASASSSSSSSSASDPALTFLIRPYDGFTARLRDTAAQDASPTSLRVLVDGPYGHATRFDEFDAVLFLVGGSGIVVPLSHLTGIAAAVAAASSTEPSTTSTMSTTSSAASSTASTPSSAAPRAPAVRIVWAAREPAMAADVLRTDFSGILGAGSAVRIDIYLTQATDARPLEDQADDIRDTLDHSPPQVRFLHGRPDVRGEIEAAMKTTGERGRLAVVACGPARMADDARRTIVDLLGTRGTSDVEYFEESFQW